MRGRKLRRNRRRRRNVRPTISRVLRPLGHGVEPLETRNLLAASVFEDSPLQLDAVDSTDQVEATVFPRLVDAANAANAGRIVNGNPTSNYPAVGIVNDGCTGTLIASNAVLTAAHCMEGYTGGFIGNRDGTFEVGGQNYGSSQIHAHPQYSPNVFGEEGANDIAIMTLAQNIPGITPMEIFRGTPQVGDMLTLVGFGGGGTGNGGHNGDFGTKREGTTPIDQVTETLIHWTFDNNGESNTAPGDSGGPAFVTVDGQCD